MVTMSNIVRSKANPCVASDDGATPLDEARRAKCLQCVRTIEDIFLFFGFMIFLLIYLKPIFAFSFLKSSLLCVRTIEDSAHTYVSFFPIINTHLITLFSYAQFLKGQSIHACSTIIVIIQNLTLCFFFHNCPERSSRGQHEAVAYFRKDRVFMHVSILFHNLISNTHLPMRASARSRTNVKLWQGLPPILFHFPEPYLEIFSLFSRTLPPIRMSNSRTT